MLREQHNVFRGILMGTDAIVVAIALVAAYVLRWHVLVDLGLLDLSGADLPAWSTHAIPVVVAIGGMILAMMWAGLYKPRRDQRFFGEAWSIFKAIVAGTLMTYAFVEFFERALYGGQDFSRWQFVIFAALSLVFLLSWRFSFRTLLRWIRKHGWNLRHVAIIGTGRLGQQTCRRLQVNTWTGIKPAYFVSHHARTARTECQGLPVLGGLADLERTLVDTPVSGVFLAMPQRYASEIAKVLSRLESHAVDVRLIPDVNPRHSPFSMTVSELDGMPVLTVRETPLNGWGRIAKRALDIIGALAAIMVFAIPMIMIAAFIRLSGPGPVFFRQQRTSFGGRTFTIYKFRTMRQSDDDIEHRASFDKGSDGWTQREDPRITPIGRFLRRASLDELPQLFNVLRGHMSLVGPRPEMSDLIDRHQGAWRQYMFRQHVKAGMTGWAQVNGLRGNTSLRKRLQYDLFYIRHWSIGFDLRILWLTLFRGFVHQNAH